MILDALLIALIVVSILGVAATGALWSWYYSDPHRPRSWVLWMLASSSTGINIAALYVSFLALRRLLGLGPIDLPAVITGIAILVLESVPIYYAVTYLRRRYRE